jgi:Lon protease-like protein
VPAISGEIPLLPLPMVLFPGTFLPIQVAEDSHRALLRACVEEGHRVAVVLTPGECDGPHSAVPCTTGCLASVAMLAHAEGDEDDDEPISAVLYGEQRIRVVNFVQQDPYLTGNIETLDEYHGTQAVRRTEQAAVVFRQYLELIRRHYGTDVVDYSLPEDPTLASYMLASVLLLPVEVKQRWLESASTALRLEEELAYLRAECEKHEALYALSEHMNRRYSVPDIKLFLALASSN